MRFVTEYFIKYLNLFIYLSTYLLLILFWLFKILYFKALISVISVHAQSDSGTGPKEYRDGYRDRGRKNAISSFLPLPLFRLFFFFSHRPHRQSCCTILDYRNYLNKRRIWDILTVNKLRGPDMQMKEVLRMNSVRFASFNEINAMMTLITLASKYSVTSPLGQVHSGDTKFGPEKCSHNVWVPKPGFNLRGHLIAIKN